MSATHAGAPASVPSHVPATLAVVVPTYDERDNVCTLIDALDRALAGIAWEAIFVDDDSPDGTADELRLRSALDPRIRVLQRIGRRGLASACIEGALATAAPYVAVMDADLQHDERVLPHMLGLLEQDRADLVIGTRYGSGGGVGEWSGSRLAGSRAATWLANRLLPTGVSDPMSGFFMFRRELFMRRVRALTGQGFKILLDLLTAGGEAARVAELPYRFRVRQAGASKLDASVAWDLATMMLERMLGGVVPARFLAFAVVGGLGVVVHFVLLSALMAVSSGPRFAAAQAIAATGAMVGNFALNNVLTFRDRRLRGWAWWRGLGSFFLVCSLGAAANVGVAAWLFDRDTGWALAGLAGIAVGAVWNYAVSAVYTWGGTGSRRRQPARRREAARDTLTHPAGQPPATPAPERFT